MSDAVPAALAAALADRYRVERELGRGGMATVYLAHDLKHDRPVAIKVLHEDLGATLGPERFLAEIKTTAKLQHPHILPLLDSGAAGGLLFYVMPFVEGETLRARLHREQQLPIDDAVRIAREVADALGYAHGHGIVHRDVKPENILLQGGHAVVADFGIALAVQSAGGSRLTQTGLSLGTPQYMSPEQAMGDKHVGPPADLYALGAVTYEMLTGEPPFTGATVQTVVAKVLSERPTPVRTIRETVPYGVEVAVLKALAKLPADRFAAASLFGDALTASLHSTDLPPTPGSEGTHMGRARAPAEARRRIVGLAAIATALVGVGYAVGSVGPDDDAVAPRIYDVALPDSAPIAFAKGSPWGEGWTALAVAPAGDFVVYIADRGADTELWYRSLLDSVARPIPGTTGAYQLAMSPDGRAVAFISGRTLRLASLAGEPVRELGTVLRPSGLTFRSADRILVADADEGLTEFDRLGGQPRKVHDAACGLPFALSDRRILCNVGLIDLGIEGLRSLAVSGSAVAANTFTAFVPIEQDDIVYSANDGSVFAARFDPATVSLEGRTLVLSGVRTEGVYGARQTAIAANGTLVFAPGDVNARGSLVRTKGVGEPTSLPVPPMRAKQFDVSPDGRRLAVTVTTAEGAEAWVYDLRSGQGFLWIAHAMLEDPRWSPDGRRLAILASDNADSGSIMIGTPSAGGALDTLRAPAAFPSHWVTSGRLLASGGGSFSGSFLVWLDFTDPNRVRVDTVRAPRGIQRGRVSPDGQLLAYMFADEIAVEPMDRTSGRTVVGRGIDPMWLDARTLVYRDGNIWFRVGLGADASLSARPERWFTDPRFIDTNLRSHALTPDGDVIYLRSQGRATAHYLRVIPGWTAQARAAVAATLGAR